MFGYPTPFHPTHKVDDEVSNYFRALGYFVTWDFSKRDGAHWYEIHEPGDGGQLIMQIDMGVPLAHIIEDMTAWHEGRKATSASNYDMRGPRTKAYKKLLATVAANKMEHSYGATSR